METLANKNIKILESITNVNSISKNSRINNSIIKIGDSVFEREDAIFYENIEIENNIFRPMLDLKQNEIFLDCINNRKVKSINIKKFDIQ